MKRIGFFIVLLLGSTLLSAQMFTKNEIRDFYLKVNRNKFNNQYIYTTKDQTKYMKISIVYNQKTNESSLEFKFSIKLPNWIFLEEVLLYVNGEKIEFASDEIDREMKYNPLYGGIYVEEGFTYIASYPENKPLVDFLSEINAYQKVQLVFIGQEREKDIILNSYEKESIFYLIQAYSFVGDF